MQRLSRNHFRRLHRTRTSCAGFSFIYVAAMFAKIRRTGCPKTTQSAADLQLYNRYPLDGRCYTEKVICGRGEGAGYGYIDSDAFAGLYGLYFLSALGPVRSFDVELSPCNGIFVLIWDCGGNLGPNPSYAARPKSLRYCMGLL